MIALAFLGIFGLGVLLGILLEKTFLISWSPEDVNTMLLLIAEVKRRKALARARATN